MIRLHQFEISPFCDKVRRILHVKGRPYQVVEVPVTRTFQHMRRLSRIGKLPCLEMDGTVVPDSTDIARVLEERFPDPPLLPADPRERALCHVLEDWADESLYFYEMALRFTIPENARRFAPELLKHDPAWARTVLAPLVPRLMRRVTRAQGVGRKPRGMLLRDVERHVDAVGGLLARPPAGAAGHEDGRDWLVGDALSLADLSVFAQLTCIRATDQGAKIVEGRPSVAAWMERVDRASRAPRA
ncbi:MAG: glutathione S-transferase family protein [Myxococcota bacterium]|nr:glutathione S-transferase family protein [Myxococcota bacterium]